MNKYVKNLKAVIKESRISLETASRFIGCSSKTVLRWLIEENIPQPVSEQKIRIGIKRIKEEFPDFKTEEEKTAYGKTSARGRGSFNYRLTIIEKKLGMDK